VISLTETASCAPIPTPGVTLREISLLEQAGNTERMFGTQGDTMKTRREAFVPLFHVFELVAEVEAVLSIPFNLAEGCHKVCE
jgi:hypothetical protein